jgi:hypothetical protein
VEFVEDAAPPWERLSRSHLSIDSNKGGAFGVISASLDTNDWLISDEANPVLSFVFGFWEADTFEFWHQIRRLRTNFSRTLGETSDRVASAQ